MKSKMSEGVLIAVSGFSGAGKGTIMKRLLDKYPGYALSVSATTRDPRDGEREGIEYFFKTEDEFKTMIQNGELLEYAGYVGHYYGTPKKYVEEMQTNGKNVLLEIEVQGALKVKKANPDTVMIFVVAPSVKEIENRLNSRGTESKEKIAERMEQIKREIKSISEYDYLIVNEDIEKSVDLISNIVEAERTKVKNKKYFINKLSEEINGGIK